LVDNFALGRTIIFTIALALGGCAVSERHERLRFSGFRHACSFFYSGPDLSLP
jgi:hypothetical protein